MCNKQEELVITIFYPRRPGFILKAHNLQQEIATHFGLSAEVEEQVEECFKVLLNSTVIYQNITEDISHIEHNKIISSIGEYKQPLATRSVTEPPQPDDNDDPDHRQWMNSVCSGE